MDGSISELDLSALDVGRSEGPGRWGTSVFSA